MVKFFSLSSGSNGNCYYIGNEHTALLIDAGIGPRTIKKRLAEYNIPVENIELVLVTHDHIDHIKSLGVFAERFSVPVFATDVLHKSLDTHFCTRGRLKGCVRKTIPGEVTTHKGINFIPFIVPHDATQTVGYYIDFYGVKFTFLTDLGEVTEDVIKYSSKCKILILESNYDVDMLMCGNYHPQLKTRIMENKEHLSNDQTASALKRIYHKDLSHILLCHLSENNNSPSLALASASRALHSLGVKVNQSLDLECLPRRVVSKLFEF